MTRVLCTELPPPPKCCRVPAPRFAGPVQALDNSTHTPIHVTAEDFPELHEALSRGEFTIWVPKVTQ